jgi:hypothetical protein
MMFAGVTFLTRNVLTRLEDNVRFLLNARFLDIVLMVLRGASSDGILGGCSALVQIVLSGKNFAMTSNLNL